MAKEKISARQFFALYIMSVLSPAMRLFPAVCARYGGAAGWLAPLIAAVVPALAVVMIAALNKNRDSADFCDLLESALGRSAGKILLIVYFVWTLLLFIVYTRYYAERLVTSLFTSAKPDVFIVAMLALVLVAARGGAAPLARFSEFTAPFFAVALIVFFVSLAPTFKLSNILPVTYYDAAPVLRSALPVAGVWGLMTPLLFLSRPIENKQDIKKYGRRAVLIIAAASILAVLAAIGSLGSDAAARMPLPFLKIAKLIDIMQSFDRFEAILSSIWTVADFILLAALALVLVSIVKRFFNLTDTKHLALPVVIFGCVLSLAAVPDRLTLERISGSPLTHVLSLALCLAVPALALAAGKLRGRSL